jgi:hypothetical protein
MAGQYSVTIQIDPEDDKKLTWGPDSESAEQRSDQCRRIELRKIILQYDDLGPALK